MHVAWGHARRAGAVVGLAALIGLGLTARSGAQTGTFGGYDFFLTTTAEDWNAAEAEGVADGGHLASITSQAEENFIINTFCSLPVGVATPLWIGGTDGSQTHVYHWTDGSPFVYTDYKSGEPNDSGGNEDFLTVNWQYSRGDGAFSVGNWNDTPLDGTRGYGGRTDGPYYGIIEKPAGAPGAAVPEPAVGALFALGLLPFGLIVCRRRSV